MPGKNNKSCLAAIKDPNSHKKSRLFERLKKEKKACQWSTRCLCPARPSLWSGARQVEGLFTSIFWNVPVKDKFSQNPVGDMNDYFQVGNIFRILKRTRIDLELRSQWPEVGVVGVTACAPTSTHFSDFILQTTRLFLVSQDVCELYSIIYIFFYFIKIHKKFVWKQTR